MGAPHRFNRKVFSSAITSLASLLRAARNIRACTSSIENPAENSIVDDDDDGGIDEGERGSDICVCVCVRA